MPNQIDGELVGKHESPYGGNRRFRVSGGAGTRDTEGAAWHPVSGAAGAAGVGGAAGVAQVADDYGGRPEEDDLRRRTILVDDARCRGSVTAVDHLDHHEEFAGPRAC